MELQKNDYSESAIQKDIDNVAEMLHSKYSAIETYDFLKRVLKQVCKRYKWVPHKIDIDKEIN